MPAEIHPPPAWAGAVPRWLILPALGVLGMAIVMLIYVTRPDAYVTLMRAWMARPYAVPFIDAQQVPTLVACWERGVDVYKTAPCDPLGRNFAYSPLFLRAHFLPGWGNWMGVALVALWSLSLAVLPTPRNPGGWAVMIAAMFSSMPAFALERGNMDILIFVLAAAGGWVMLRAATIRLAGYGLITFAGLLKFYPLVLFLLFLRETLRVFIALCVAAAAVVWLFLWYYHGELVEMAQNLPVYTVFTDGFGARELASGLGKALQFLLADMGLKSAALDALPDSHDFAFNVFIVQFGLTILGIALLSRWRKFAAAIAALPRAEALFLVIGAAMMAGCYFVTQNLDYRGILFIFTIPGLLALAGPEVAAPVRGVFRATIGGLLFILWGLSLQQVIAWVSGGRAFPPQLNGSALVYVYWITHELVWSAVIIVLTAALICWGLQSTTWRALKRLSAR
jgi:hypothetical protein